MAVQVKVPMILRRHTNDESVLSGKGSTLREVLEDIDARYPGIARSLITAEGDLHRFVNVYVNDEDVRYLGALETEVRDGDVVSILPAVAGGASQPGRGGDFYGPRRLTGVVRPL